MSIITANSTAITYSERSEHKRLFQIELSKIFTVTNDVEEIDTCGNKVSKELSKAEYDKMIEVLSCTDVDKLEEYKRDLGNAYYRWHSYFTVVRLNEGETKLLMKKIEYDKCCITNETNGVVEFNILNAKTYTYLDNFFDIIETNHVRLALLLLLLRTTI